MTSTTRIAESMEVVGSDGHHIGEVEHVVGEDIELAEFDFGAGLKRRRIPRTWVEHVDEKVHLNLSSNEAKSNWRE